MTTRGVVIVSVMFGLFVLSFGALGVRALTLGPDAPTPSATEVATRQQAADSLERSIQTARADVPPALPAIPTRVVAAPAAPAAVPVAVSSTAREAAPARQGESYDDEGYEDERYESEDRDDDHGGDGEGDYEEGDRDDD